MTRLALLKSTCTGELCSHLPQQGDTSLLKSLSSGQIFSYTVLSENEEDSWHYGETDSSYTVAEGNGSWCYVQEGTLKGKYKLFVSRRLLVILNHCDQYKDTSSSIYPIFQCKAAKCLDQKVTTYISQKTKTSALRC